MRCGLTKLSNGSLPFSKVFLVSLSPSVVCWLVIRQQILSGPARLVFEMMSAGRCLAPVKSE